MDRGLAGKGLSALALQLLVVHARCGVDGDELVRELQDSVHVDAGMGLVVFFSLPALAFSGSTSQTAIFVYESPRPTSLCLPGTPNHQRAPSKQDARHHHRRQRHAPDPDDHRPGTLHDARTRPTQRIRSRPRCRRAHHHGRRNGDLVTPNGPEGRHLMRHPRIQTRSTTDSAQTAPTRDPQVEAQTGRVAGHHARQCDSTRISALHRDMTGGPHD